MRISELLIESLESEFIPRIQKAIDKNGISEDWKNTVANYRGDDIAEKLLNYFKELDPTDRDTYTKWIATIWARGNLPSEDAYKVTEYLQIYEKAKKANKLPPEAKDINRLKSVSDLYNAIRELRQEEMKSKKQLKRDEVQELFDNGEAELIFSHPKFRIMKVNTERASCILGRGTEWCTAATESNNYFERYNNEGDLYIITFKGSPDKYQFHIPYNADEALNKFYDLIHDRIEVEYAEEEQKFINEVYNELEDAQVQFMDEHDEEIDVQDLLDQHRELKEWPGLEKVLILYSPGMYGVLNNVKDKGTQTLLVELDPSYIKYIDNPTNSQKVIAVKDSPQAIEYINELTSYIVTTWARYNSMHIQYYWNIISKFKDALITLAKNGFHYPPTDRAEPLSMRYGELYHGTGLILDQLLKVGAVSDEEVREILRRRPRAYNKLTMYKDKVRPLIKDIVSELSNYEYNEGNNKVIKTD